MFNYYKTLLIQGFLELKLHVDSLCALVAIMSENSDLPCFQQFSIAVFRDRFKEKFSD